MSSMVSRSSVIMSSLRGRSAMGASGAVHRDAHLACAMHPPNGGKDQCIEQAAVRNGGTWLPSAAALRAATVAPPTHVARAERERERVVHFAKVCQLRR